MKQPVKYHTLEKSGVRWSWLGRIAYPESESLQKQLEQERRRQTIPDTLILLEHPHVYTLGRSATERDILIPETQRRKAKIEVFRTDRGGQVTYHGPGQLVGYLIANLYERHLSVPQFVWSVEEGMRRWMASQGVPAKRRDRLPGLWVGNKKLASIGFHISRGISRHGFSINLQSKLNYFEGIIPCGLPTAATSMSQEISSRFDIKEVASQVAIQFDEVFGDLYSEAVSSDVPLSASGVSSASL